MANEDIAARTLKDEYLGALREYVATASEAALTRAYALGRKAAAGGLGILELAMLHHEALLDLPLRGAGDRSPVTMSGQFLAEALSPFEMTLRSYRANARLLGLSEMLAERNAEIDRAREQLRTILDATTAVIYLKDAQGRYLFVNRQFLVVFGRRRQDLIGKLDEDVLPPPVATTLSRDDLAVLEARAPLELEEIIPAADGAHTYLSLKFPLLDGRGAPYGICCVATDITERKRAEEALQRAREADARERQLKNALEGRDEFISLASHELRTPVTSLELQVAIFRRLAASAPTLDAEVVRSRCAVFQKHVDRMRMLVNALVEVARMTSGHVELSRERIDLAELVRAIVTKMRPTIEGSRSNVTLDVDGPVIGAWDRVGVEAVVSNLLSNALKFGRGEPVEISISASGDHVQLTVRDHGIGICAEDQARIFDRFERAVPLRHFGGFGIGLYVARKAVEAHGGSIRLSSEPGQGSAFTVELPLDGPARA